jgi:hypothetical protein
MEELNKWASELGLQINDMLCTSDTGTEYKTDNPNQVIKTTHSKEEFFVAMNLNIKSNNHLLDVHDVKYINDYTMFILQERPKEFIEIDRLGVFDDLEPILSNLSNMVSDHEIEIDKLLSIDLDDSMNSLPKQSGKVLMSIYKGAQKFQKLGLKSVYIDCASIELKNNKNYALVCQEGFDYTELKFQKLLEKNKGQKKNKPKMM